MRRRIIAGFLLLCLCLSGCGEEPDGKIRGSEVWETMPVLTYGVMEYEKLEVLPWNTGRLGFTSGNTMEETASGYYYAHNGKLVYADKTNLQLWLCVCNQPSCGHTNAAACSAKMEGSSFLLVNNRIVLEKSTAAFPQYSQSLGNVLASMAPDGSDMQAAYYLEEAMLKDAGATRCVLFPDCWLYFSNTLSADGSIQAKMFKVDETGVSTVIDTAWGDRYPEFQNAAEWYRLYGDRYFYYEALSADALFHFEEGALTSFDITHLPSQGGYISGTTLRTFRTNSGYFDINVQTGETVCLAENQLTDSHAVILLPNCIVESTLFWDSADSREDGTPHAMTLFDGERWRTVALPKELQDAAQKDYIRMVGVASDRVFFMLINGRTAANPRTTSKLYCICLNSDSLAAEFCGEIEPQ